MDLMYKDMGKELKTQLTKHIIKVSREFCVNKPKIRLISITDYKLIDNIVSYNSIYVDITDKYKLMGTQYTEHYECIFNDINRLCILDRKTIRS